MQETYETIFISNPALPATAEVPALPAPTKVSPVQDVPPLINSNNTITTYNAIAIGWFPALEPPRAPPPLLLPNIVAVENVIPMTWFPVLEPPPTLPSLPETTTSDNKVSMGWFLP